jgi:hypothetical protein
MSLQQHEYITNPETGRPVKKFSRMHNALIRRGIVPEEVNHSSKVLYRLKEHEDEDEGQEGQEGHEEEEQIRELKEKFDKELEENDEQCVKGRGIYKNKLVKRKVPPKTTKVIRKTKEMIEERSKKEKETYTDLERMIMQVLADSSDDEDEY